jgi:hypothetical protein
MNSAVLILDAVTPLKAQRRSTNQAAAVAPPTRHALHAPAALPTSSRQSNVKQQGLQPRTESASIATRMLPQRAHPRSIASARAVMAMSPMTVWTARRASLFTGTKQLPARPVASQTTVNACGARFSGCKNVLLEDDVLARSLLNCDCPVACDPCECLSGVRLFLTGADMHCVATLKGKCSLVPACPETSFRVGECGGGSNTYQCQDCTACSDGEYQTSACTSTADTQCAACSSCDGGQFIHTACSGSVDTQCSTCKQCGSTEYEHTACTTTTDATCAACADHPTATCNVDEFRTGACGDGAVAYECSTCNACDASAYVTVACQESGLVTTDRTCAACSAHPFATCPDQQHRIGACGGDVSSSDEGASATYQCEECTVCDKSQYMTAQCALSVDRQCTPCTSCTATEYETRSCQKGFTDMSADRQCSSCNGHAAVRVEFCCVSSFRSREECLEEHAYRHRRYLCAPANIPSLAVFIP